MYQHKITNLRERGIIMKPDNFNFDLVEGNLTKHALLNILEDIDLFHPGISVDCVILGFHDGCLKVLLVNFNKYGKWLLPGGFVYRNEDVDAAAYRMVKSRVGIDNIFLKQFHLFGDVKRTSAEENMELLQSLNISERAREWFSKRFITMGYYSLVQYLKIKSLVKDRDEDFQWFKLNELPDMYGDHEKIIKKAIESIRQQIGFVPIGYELLPEKFTMPELRTIYESIIGHEIDRRNFQRKMLSIGLVRRLNEFRRGGAYKSPILYSFVKEKYDAVKNGTMIADLHVLMV